jgi:hypothetical protein
MAMPKERAMEIPVPMERAWAMEIPVPMERAWAMVTGQAPTEGQGSRRRSWQLRRWVLPL